MNHVMVSTVRSEAGATSRGCKADDAMMSQRLVAMAQTGETIQNTQQNNAKCKAFRP